MPDQDDLEAFTDLTGFRRDIIATLADLGPSKGIAIKEEIEDLYGESIYHGRLYPNLEDLIDAGLIAKGEIDRRTNEYRLTERGEAALLAYNAWITKHAAAVDVGEVDS